MCWAPRHAQEKHLLALQHLLIRASRLSPLWLISFLTSLKENEDSSGSGLSPQFSTLVKRRSLKVVSQHRLVLRVWVRLTGGTTVQPWVPSPKLQIIETIMKLILGPHPHSPYPAVCRIQVFIPLLNASKTTALSVAIILLSTPSKSLGNSPSASKHNLFTCYYQSPPPPLPPPRLLPLLLFFVSLCACTYVGVHRGQKRTSDPLELEL